MKRIFLSIAALSLGFLSISATSASAHTDEATSSPAADSVVNAGVIPIEITFGEALLETEDATGSDIVVRNAEGVDSPVICATVDGASLVAETELVDPGTYTVTWRTVAEDGHAQSGSYSFDVINENGYTATDSVVECPNHVTPTEDPSIYQTEALAGEEPADAGQMNLWVAFGIAVFIIFIFALLGALKIRRQDLKRERENR